MNTLYNGAVGYEKIKSFAGMIFLIVIGLCFVSSSIASIYSNVTTVVTSGRVLTYDNTSGIAKIQYTRNNKEQIDDITTALVEVGSIVQVEYNSTGSSPATISQSSYGWLMFCCFAIICFLFAYGAYYMTTNKSMEKVLAVKGAIDAANTVSSIFKKSGGYFDVGE